MKKVTTENPFFNVIRVPLFVEIGGRQIETKKSAIVNNENGNVYGMVSPKYNIVTNEEVASIFQEAFVNYPVETVTDHINNDGSKWYREIVFGDKYQKEVQVGDIVKTKIRIHNSYDGLSSVGYEFGSMRLVCTNGLTSYQKGSKMSFRHFQKEIIEQIQTSFEVGFNKFLNEFKLYEELAQTPYTEKQFIKFVLNEVKQDDEDNGLLSERQANKIISSYGQIRNQYNDHRDTKWSNLNVLTAYQTHYTKAHSGSNLFSAGYKKLDSLIERFIKS